MKVGKDGKPVAYVSPPGSPKVSTAVDGQPQSGMNSHAVGFGGTPAASPSPLPSQVKNQAWHSTQAHLDLVYLFALGRVVPPKSKHHARG